jgi:hypothetical protein
VRRRQARDLLSELPQRFLQTADGHGCAAALGRTLQPGIDKGDVNDVLFFRW